MKKDKGKIIKKLTMEVIIRENEKGENRITVASTNDGFTIFELIGLFDWKKEDLYKQFIGEIKPDIVKRTVIAPEDKK